MVTCVIQGELYCKVLMPILLKHFGTCNLTMQRVRKIFDAMLLKDDYEGAYPADNIVGLILKDVYKYDNCDTVKEMFAIALNHKNAKLRGLAISLSQ